MAQPVITVAENNRASEAYFRDRAHDAAMRSFWLNKPFSDVGDCGRSFLRLGAVLAALRLTRADTVVDFGAGSGWLTSFFCRMGLRVIGVDVAHAGLKLGTTLLASRRPWEGDGEAGFVVYDGETLPLADGSVTKIVCFDSFHHVPNKARLLAEFGRVLAEGGMAGFTEPGEGHSQSPISIQEMSEYGVLESDVLLEEVWEWARDAGFSELRVIPHFPAGLTVPWPGAKTLREGKLDARTARELGAVIRGSAVFVLTKGGRVPTSRNPSVLAARLTPLVAAVEARPGEEFAVPVRLTNTGDTCWLAAPHRRGGHVTARLCLKDSHQRIVDRDFAASLLPHDLAPGDEVTVEIRGRAPGPGGYLLELDMVDEQICWFQQRGSLTTTIPLTVR